MRLDFICPGMSKCGTTTLHDILKQHPNICVPRFHKEPKWLNNFNLCTNRDMAWYAERYYGISEKNPQKDNILYGEINPSFGVAPAKRLHDSFGGCKIIFMFRNPIERLWSHFNVRFNSCNVMQSKSANEMLASCESQTEAFSLFCNTNFERIGSGMKYTGTFARLVNNSGYAFNVKTYLKFFERENIKVILFEDFVNNPEEVCKDLFAFLGVSEDEAIDYSIKSNVGDYHATTMEERGLLADLYRKKERILQNGSSEEMNNFSRERRIIVNKIRNNTQNGETEHPSQECIEMLQEYFSDDKKYVEEYLQRDLSDLWF